MRAPHRLAGRAERAWRAEVCERFVPLEIRDMVPTGRDAIHGTRAGAVTFATVRAGPQTVLRGRDGIRRGGGDHVFLNLQMAGACDAEQGPHALRLRPGDIGLFDAGAPYRLRFDGPFTQHVLHIPRAMLGGRGGRWPLAGGVIAGDGGAARTLRSLLATCGARALDPAEADALARAAFLLAEAACPARDAPEAGATTRARALEVIAREHSDPDLTVDALAARLGCSRRHLHAAFAGSGTTVARAIWRHRLQSAARRLQTCPDTPLAMIGWDCGFRSPSHFSSRFRQAFGMTPRAWRDRRRSLR